MMTVILSASRYKTRIAACDDDVRQSQELRQFCFFDYPAGATEPTGRRDKDALDELYDHILVEDAQTGHLSCTIRVMHIKNDDDLSRCYSAQYFDLTPLQNYGYPVIDAGRLCIHPRAARSAVFRVAWRSVLNYAIDKGAALLFGCPSFQGTDPDMYRHAFALLQNHIGPAVYSPGKKAERTINFKDFAQSTTADRRSALPELPPLLRNYLSVGAWVSDHAAVDPIMKTMVVFTGAELANIPPSRLRMLKSGDKPHDRL